MIAIARVPSERIILGLKLILRFIRSAHDALEGIICDVARLSVSRELQVCSNARHDRRPERDTGT